MAFADEGEAEGGFQLSELRLEPVLDGFLPHDGVVLVRQPEHVALLQTARLQTDPKPEHHMFPHRIAPLHQALVVLVEDLEFAGQHEPDQSLLQLPQGLFRLVAFDLADEEEGLEEVAVESVEDGVVEGEFGEDLLPDDVAHEVVGGVVEFQVPAETGLEVVHGREGLLLAAVDHLLLALQLHLAVLALEDVVFGLEQQFVPAEVDLAVVLARGGVQTALLLADVLPRGGGGPQSEVGGVFGRLDVVRTGRAALHAVIFW